MEKVRKLKASHKQWPKGSYTLSEDNLIIGVDIGAGADYSAYTVMKPPSRLRLFMRRIGLDRSTWKFKIIAQGILL
jgi:hypothetical protein